MVECLYRQADIPVLQNRVYTSMQDAAGVSRGEICLGLTDSGVVENHAFRGEMITYGPGYDNSQQASAAFRHHLDEVAEICTNRFLGKRVYEIGAGDGAFLERLEERGIDARGCDPASDGMHPLVDVGSFQMYGSSEVDVLVLRHVVEHIPKPENLFKDLAHYFPSASEIYVEVPNLNWIIAERAWFDITYEHVNYFSPIVLQSMFGSNTDVRVMFNGQFIGVFADLRSLRSRSYVSASEIDRVCAGVKQLQEARDASIRDLREYCRERGLPVAIWGMAGKGAMLLEAIESAGISISKVIDINPNKWHKYSTRGQMIQPGESMFRKDRHLIIVSNGAYLDEVTQCAGNGHTYATVTRGGLVLV